MKQLMSKKVLEKLTTGDVMALSVKPAQIGNFSLNGNLFRTIETLDTLHISMTCIA